MTDRRDQANRRNINDELDDERYSEDYTAEEDELYSDEMEVADELDDVDPPASGESYPEEDYPKDDYPENLTEDDLKDDTTDYSEAELHDEQMSGENIVNDLDMGEAMYYEKDSDYQHIDGPGEGTDELDEEEAYDLDDLEIEKRLINEEIEDEDDT